MAKKAPPTNLYLLRVQLAEVRPAIWRDLMVPGDATLAVLHAAIQAAFPWTNSHLHAFKLGRASLTDTTGDPDAGKADERRFTVADVLPRAGMKLRYEYDFSEGWLHEIRVREILPFEVRQRVQGTRCVGGARACPPDDCGGAPGYEELLAALARPNHARHEELSEWLTSHRAELAHYDSRFKGPFDPEAFDVDAANKAVEKATSSKRR